VKDGIVIFTMAISAEYKFEFKSYDEATVKLMNRILCEYIIWTTETVRGGLYGYVRFCKKRSSQGVERLLAGADVEDATNNSSAVIATVKMLTPFEERGRVVLAVPKPCRWTDAVTAAKEGRFGDIPSDIYIKHYDNLQRIYRDAARRGSLPTVWDLPAMY